MIITSTKNLYLLKYIIAMSLILFLTMFTGVSVVSAGSPIDVEQKIDRVAKGKTNNDVFASATNETKELGASGYRLVTAVGIVGAIMSFIVCAIGWAWNKSSQKHQENKDWLVRISLGCLIIFSATTLISLAFSIFSSVKF